MRKITKNYKVMAFDQNSKEPIEQEWSNSEKKKKYITSLASEIGWIIIEFSSLENKLDNILYFHLIETSKNKEIMYSLINEKKYSDKINIFSKMLLLNYLKHPNNYISKINDFETTLENIVGKLREASLIRNKYAHSIWSSISETRFVESQTKISKKGIEKVYMKYDYQDLDDDYNNLFDIGNLLSEFNEKLLDCYSLINT
jgi:hypothetical protein